jgi:hypothetical protein
MNIHKLIDALGFLQRNDLAKRDLTLINKQTDQDYIDGAQELGWDGADDDVAGAKQFLDEYDAEKFAKGDWEEGKHPRASDGKFGEGGGAPMGEAAKRYERLRVALVQAHRDLRRAEKNPTAVSRDKVAAAKYAIQQIGEQLEYMETASLREPKVEGGAKEQTRIDTEHDAARERDLEDRPKGEKAIDSGDTQKDFDEAKHPRSSDGKFGAGGGEERPSQERAAVGARAAVEARRARSEHMSGKEYLANVKTRESKAAADKWLSHPYFKGNKEPAQILQAAVDRGYQVLNDRTLIVAAKETMTGLAMDDADYVRGQLTASEARAVDNGDADLSEFSDKVQARIDSMSSTDPTLREEMASHLGQDAEDWLAEHKKKASETGDLSKEYDESQHPRGEDGKFSAGGGAESLHRPPTVDKEKWDGMSTKDKQDARESYSRVVGRASGAARERVEAERSKDAPNQYKENDPKHQYDDQDERMGEASRLAEELRSNDEHKKLTKADLLEKLRDLLSALNRGPEGGK